jgi:hypothetical protein
MHGPMTTPDPGAPEARAGDPHLEPIMTLRGAGVDFDVRRVGRIVIGLCVVALAVTTVIFYIAGAQKNNQIARLHQHGVPVTVTVTGCIGLMGGSGSNAAGYSCQGTFTRDGSSHTESIPGVAFYKPGATLRALTVPGDPALLSPISIERSQHTSDRVFILPTVLLILLVLLVGGILLRRRQKASSPA